MSPEEAQVVLRRPDEHRLTERLRAHEARLRYPLAMGEAARQIIMGEALADFCLAVRIMLENDELDA